MATNSLTETMRAEWRAKWVDERMSELNAAKSGAENTGPAWEPNVVAAWARFDAKQRREWHAWPRLRWAGAVSGALSIALLMLMLPAGRALAHKCLECSVAAWQYTISVRGSEWAPGLVPVEQRKAAPDFNLQDASGSNVSLSSLKGKVVLLNFWATWCEGCQVEIPWFIQFQKKFQQQGLVVVGVSMDDDGWKAVRPWIQEKGVNYPIVIGSKQLSDDYAVSGMPQTVLIDRDGKIACVESGLVKRVATEKRIRALLTDFSLHVNYPYLKSEAK
jgi:peroxiredoxin